MYKSGDVQSTKGLQLQGQIISRINPFTMGEGVPARRTGPIAKSDSFLAHQCAEYNGENEGGWDKCPTCGLSKGLTNSDVNLQNLSQTHFHFCNL